MDNLLDKVTERACRSVAIAAMILLSLSPARGAGEGWKLDRAATMLDRGQKVTLNIKGDAPEGLKWVSDNGKVAKVSRKGVVKARRNGDAVITAINEETGESSSCLVSVGYEAQNPILPPTWDLFIADGEPHVFDGRMYIFGSRDYYDGLDRQGWSDWCGENYHVIWSDDLVHWTDAGEALDIKDIPLEVKGEGGRRLWAPDVFRDPVTGKYYMTACTNNSKVFILESDAPEGPYTNPRTITKDGKPMVYGDPAVLVDDDGKVYIALPQFFVGQLDPEDYSKIIPETVRELNPWMPDDNDPIEGPSLRKVGDTYYYVYIQNHGKLARDGSYPARMAYLTSEDPLGPYEYQGLIVSNYDYPNAVNIHGGFEEFGGQWYIQYHKSVPGLRITRVPNLEPFGFEADGRIPWMPMSTSGVRGAFRPGDRVQAGGAVEYSTGREGGLIEENSIGRDGGIMMKIRGAENDGFSTKRMTGYPYISFSEAGQWTGYRWFDLSLKARKLEACVRSGDEGGIIEFRKGSPDGEVIATVEVPATKGEWKTVKAPAKVSGSAKETVYAVAAKAPSGSPLELDYFTIK